MLWTVNPPGSRHLVDLLPLLPASPGQVVTVRRRGREVFLALQKGLLTPFGSGGVGLLFFFFY